MVCGKMSVVFVVSFRVRIIESLQKPQYYAKRRASITERNQQKVWPFLAHKLNFSASYSEQVAKSQNHITFFIPIN